MVYTLTFSAQITSDLRKLPPDRQKRVKHALGMFLEMPDNNNLRFRAFAGAPDYYLINGARGDRIALKKIGKDEFQVIMIDTHDKLLRRLKRHTR